MTSTRGKPAPATIFAASAMAAGREPNICAATTDASSSPVTNRRVVFSLRRIRPSAEMSGVTANAQPNRATAARNGYSV